jgi:hypothetical protein
MAHLLAQYGGPGDSPKRLPLIQSKSKMYLLTRVSFEEVRVTLYAGPKYDYVI